MSLTFREPLRWVWRQLTSMRTALVLLLLLALAAVPGSIIPQEGVDALRTTQWQEQHPDLTPVYERLGLFDRTAAPWFALDRAADGLAGRLHHPAHLEARRLPARRPAPRAAQPRSAARPRVVPARTRTSTPCSSGRARC